MKKEIKAVLLTFFVLIILLRFASAADFNYVISNSEDWKDVFSSCMYANFIGVDNGFLVSTAHGSIILNDIPKTYTIRVLTSTKKPYVFNYPDLIKSQGYTGADEISSDNLNLRLINEFPDINSFIIVGDSYGFSAIAVAPYAKLTRSWVFFANRQNIYNIDSVLSKRNNIKVLEYGFLDQQVTSVLAKYNPEVINNNDRFKDNIDIVKKYIGVHDTKQVILTNGEFLEKEIMSGTEPNLFTGKDNVPDEIRDYIKSSGIEVGVLIGNDLVGAATNIRRSAGISVMVKFARGARTQTGGVSQVEGLDLFPVPIPTVSISLSSIKFNRATGKLEVTYKSNSNVPVFFKGTINLISGLDNIRVGDLNTIFIAPGEFKTVIYPVNLTSTDNLTAQFSTLFGETASSLDRLLQGTVNVDVVNVIDRCVLTEDSIQSINYNKQKKQFTINVKNSNDVDCWVSLELENLLIGLQQTTLSSGTSIMIEKGKSKDITINQEMTQDDLDKNPFIDISAYSGEREDTLINFMHWHLPLKIESLSLLAYASIGVAITIVIFIIIIIVIKRRQDDDD